MPKYVKPSGAEVEVNPGSEEYAKSLGWVLATEKPAEEAPKKRGRKPKVAHGDSK